MRKYDNDRLAELSGRASALEKEVADLRRQIDALTGQQQTSAPRRRASVFRGSPGPWAPVKQAKRAASINRASLVIVVLSIAGAAVTIAGLELLVTLGIDAGLFGPQARYVLGYVIIAVLAAYTVVIARKNPSSWLAVGTGLAATIGFVAVTYAETISAHVLLAPAAALLGVAAQCLSLWWMRKLRPIAIGLTTIGLVLITTWSADALAHVAAHQDIASSWIPVTIVASSAWLTLIISALASGWLCSRASWVIMLTCAVIVGLESTQTPFGMLTDNRIFMTTGRVFIVVLLLTWLIRPERIGRPHTPVTFMVCLVSALVLPGLDSSAYLIGAIAACLVIVAIGESGFVLPGSTRIVTRGTDGQVVPGGITAMHKVCSTIGLSCLALVAIEAFIDYRFSDHISENILLSARLIMFTVAAVIIVWQYSTGPKASSWVTGSWLFCLLFGSYPLAKSVFIAKDLWVVNGENIAVAIVATVAILFVYSLLRHGVVFTRFATFIGAFMGLYLSILAVVEIVGFIARETGLRYQSAIMVGHTAVSLLWLAITAVLILKPGRFSDRNRVICGIILAVAATAKLIAFDLALTNSAIRTVAFLLCGVFMLIIAAAAARKNRRHEAPHERSLNVNDPREQQDDAASTTTPHPAVSTPEAGDDPATP